MTLRIGPYELAGMAVLAPMAGVTDRPFRVLCKRFGAALAPSEMLTSDTRLWSTAKSRLRMNHEGEPEPRVVQLAGADPAALAEAARLNVDLGAQIIDINMGCPAKKVCGAACGSALLRDEPLVARILEAVVRAVRVPVTLKMRTGWSRDERNAARIARTAESCGVQAIALHGRTREDFYEGSAEYESIREVKSCVSVPVIANGDIDGPRKARIVLDLTDADAVMLGRAAQGSPWIFRDVNGFLSAGETRGSISRAEVGAIIRSHLESLYDFYGEDAGFRIARKHLGWYCKHFDDQANVRRMLMAAQDTASQFELTNNYLGHWAEGTPKAA
jgi:tRNA-dihydrouridine synthase B